LFLGLESESLFSSGDIFSTLALFNQLAVCLSIFPVTLPILVKGLTSRKRLLEFLARPEVDRYKSLTFASDAKTATFASNAKNVKFASDAKSVTFASEAQAAMYSSDAKNATFAFEIRNAAFSWPTSISVLSGIDLTIETGSLTVISGSSGSGKSALILSLIEEMKLTSGSVHWNLDPRIALVTQKPW
jgi:ABC-type transport system involved in cytochrome bd biosynthesis fused ATPase/permease subunit